ncbi:MAG: glycosyltransferase family 2 protein [Lentisphaerae bacterium]|nr:glycosyltransferase family 2 protein [Lentisphaerota bacterium]
MDKEYTANRPELSVVMPCLNEADTLTICIEKAQRAMLAHGIEGEIIIADNGSTDGSVAIANRLGARVVHVAERGYGSALRGGIEASRGQFVIMGDADDSYDFLDIPLFVDSLREGHDLVMGCRLPAGGGTVKDGAMPTLHRWWGNPMFSAMVRSMFKAPIHDVYCGLRGFTRALYQELDLRCTGMEFATEMVIKSSLFKVRISEVPITLHPDGRKSHAPHLRTFADGWRTLRFFMLYSPRWLFLVPGATTGVLGLSAWVLALSGATFHGIRFDAHTLLFGSLFLIVGYQSILFGIFTKLFAIGEHLQPEDPRLSKVIRFITLERALLVSTGVLAIGSLLLVVAINQWRLAGFGLLDYAATMRWVVPGVTLAAIGFQTILSSLFISVLGLKHR